jgi:hypothetical protein
MTTEPGSVEKPKHPLHALTTYELASQRRELERSIAFFNTTNPVPSARPDLQTRLDAVIAEQEARTRLAARV